MVRQQAAFDRKSILNWGRGELCREKRRGGDAVHAGTRKYIGPLVCEMPTKPMCSLSKLLLCVRGFRGWTSVTARVPPDSTCPIGHDSFPLLVCLCSHCAEDVADRCRHPTERATGRTGQKWVASDNKTWRLWLDPPPKDCDKLKVAGAVVYETIGAGVRTEYFVSGCFVHFLFGASVPVSANLGSE